MVNDHYREKRTPEQHVKAILAQLGNGYKPRATFISKETRDAVARLLKANGYSYKRRMISGQNTHPEYVVDYVGYLS